MFLHRPKTESGDQPDQDERILSRRKANYASASESEDISLRWSNGVFVVQGQEGGMVASIGRRNAETVFLEAPCP